MIGRPGTALLGSLVRTAAGDGWVYAISHTLPKQYDIQLLDGKRVTRCTDIEVVKLVPTDDERLPGDLRVWLREHTKA